LEVLACQSFTALKGQISHFVSDATGYDCGIGLCLHVALLRLPVSPLLREEERAAARPRLGDPELGGVDRMRKKVCGFNSAVNPGAKEITQSMF